MTEHPKLRRALQRNLNELSNCILKRRVYNRFLALKSAHSLDFFRIAMHALHNDLYADAHRVFDKNKDAASYWYIKRIAPSELALAAKDTGVDLDDLESIMEKATHLRDRLHFHIDKRDVMEPAKVWKAAAITGNQFIRLTEEMHKVLRMMHLRLTGIDSEVPDYHGDDIEKILRAYKRAHPEAFASI